MQDAAIQPAAGEGKEAFVGENTNRQTVFLSGTNKGHGAVVCVRVSRPEGLANLKTRALIPVPEKMVSQTELADSFPVNGLFLRSANGSIQNKSFVFLDGR